jgi:hypothetical protein
MFDPVSEQVNYNFVHLFKIWSAASGATDSGFSTELQSSDPVPFSRPLRLIRYNSNEVDMGLCFAPGRDWVTGKNGACNCFMLDEDSVMRACNGENKTAVVKNAVAQQPIASPQGVHKNDVMGRVTNGAVEFDIRGKFLLEASFAMCIAHPADDPAYQLLVSHRSSPGSHFGSYPFQLTTIFKIVPDGLSMPSDKIDQRRRKNLPHDIGNERAVAMLADEKASAFEHLQGFAQDWPRNVEPLCQFPFARQALSVPQDACQDEMLDLIYDFVGGSAVGDGQE